jgi:hypothetical protein
MSEKENGWIWTARTGWRRGYVAPIVLKSTQVETKATECQDCDTSVAHFDNDPNHAPIWRDARERKAYGAFAELIEMEDEIKHMYD